LLARSTAIGKRFEERARAWQKRWSLVGDVRGLGGMCAMELVRDAATREPARPGEPADTETKEIAKFCYEHGLILITAGTFNNVIRILVPLAVTDAQFDEGLAVLESALAHVADAKPVAASHA
jgi:4-aminobutyrate aminotransferase/(S)-3-amino-2-methylpropionate transaminase